MYNIVAELITQCGSNHFGLMSVFFKVRSMYKYGALDDDEYRVAMDDIKERLRA